MLVRKNKDTYFMVSPTQQQTRIHEWMTNHIPANSTVDVQDLTSMYTVSKTCIKCQFEISNLVFFRF